MFADLKMICTFAPPLKNKGTPRWSFGDRWSFGEVAEWSIAAVLKTVVLKGTRGSNPCLSAGNGCKSSFCEICTRFLRLKIKSLMFLRNIQFTKYRIFVHINFD